MTKKNPRTAATATLSGSRFTNAEDAAKRATQRTTIEPTNSSAPKAKWRR